MSGAVFALFVNAGVAILFAASFAIIAISYRQRAAWGFCISFLLGMLTPVSELLVRFADPVALFMVTSYASFLLGMLAMAAGLAAFHGRRPPWAILGLVFAGAMLIRALTWGGARGTLPHELAYQFPMCVATLICAATVARLGGRRLLHVALSVYFALVALHFMIKPFLAVAFGSGASARDYVQSGYALFSQATTGIMLVGAGLLVLLIVVQQAVGQSQLDAETDPLAGIANRRGFDRRAQESLARARREGFAVAAVIFDLDHFKAINDTHGHATGDAVIAAFADLLRRAAPQSAILGRIGGEEFAMLLERTTVESAALSAHAIRVATAGLAGGDLPAASVSGGVAGWRGGESLAELMRRADQACYRAKNDGRNRIRQAETPQEGPGPSNVVAIPLRR